VGGDKATTVRRGPDTRGPAARLTRSGVPRSLRA
jgi:hypothetical protein